MSKEKECKCCKQIWYVDMLDKKLELCPNCYEYCKPLIDDLKIKDKQISDLQSQLAESEKRNKKAYQDGLLQKQFDKDMEIIELKQQLHDLPKKIVGEIRKQIIKDVDVTPDYHDEYDLRLSTRDKCIECLDTILKKYGGENE